MSTKPVMQYVPTSKGPIRYSKLHPGSFFQIYAEPSRKIWKSKDVRFYQRSHSGFYSEHVVTGQGCVLMPEDLVLPYRLARLPHKD